MKHFFFTVDDNIRFLKELNNGSCDSIFSHPYPAMYKRLHDELGVKVQLNLFYRAEDFDLSEMTDKFKDEWRENSDWLKLSFHSDIENIRPYEFSPYGEVYGHCQAVHREIIRFASEASLGKTTTVHYCRTTPDGTRALYDNGIRGLLGLYGDDDHPRASYSLDEISAGKIRHGEIVKINGMSHGPIDIVLNDFSKPDVENMLASLIGRERIWIMIHEQYFYPDFDRYIPDFEQRLREYFTLLLQNGYQSRHFEEDI